MVAGSGSVRKKKGNCLNCIHRCCFCYPAEFLSTLQIDFTTKAKLLAFVHCLGSIDFLSKFSSGVKLAAGKNHTIREVLLLPQLIRSIIDPHMVMDTRIKEQGARLLGKMFGSRRTTLKDYEKVYVFMFGEISFLELREIRHNLYKRNAQTSIRVISNTICSSVSILQRFSG
jgi:hypothetical protein